MQVEEMTPKERVMAFFKGEPIDRLVTVPVVCNNSAKVAGFKISEYNRDGKKIAQAQIAAFRLFRQDVVRVFTNLFVQAEAMGTKLYYPEDDTAHVEDPIVKKPEIADQLEPLDPKKDGNIPALLEAMKIVVEEIGDEVPVTSGITCPFTTAASLRGDEQFMKDLYADPELAHKLCRISMEGALRYIEACLEVGCTPGLTEPMASGSLISPKYFKEFAFPYISPLVDRIHQAGKKVTLHICGYTEPMWELMVETGADTLSIDNVVDLEKAKKTMGDRVIIMGNVTPAETLCIGTPELVMKESRECIRKAHDSPKGYILASGCSLPVETPSDNILAMMQAGLKYGKMPIDEGLLRD